MVHAWQRGILGAAMTPTQTVQFEEICRRLTLGDSLRKICSEEYLPKVQTVLRWCAADANVADQYARARQEGLDRRFDQLEDLARESRKAETKGEIAGYRNMIDVLRWQLSKQDPKRYGDKVSVEASGPDGGPIRHEGAIAVSLDPVAASQAYQQFMDPK